MAGLRRLNRPVVGRRVVVRNLSQRRRARVNYKRQPGNRKDQQEEGAQEAPQHPLDDRGFETWLEEFYKLYKLSKFGRRISQWWSGARVNYKRQHGNQNQQEDGAQEAPQQHPLDDCGFEAWLDEFYKLYKLSKFRRRVKDEEVLWIRSQPLFTCTRGRCDPSLADGYTRTRVREERYGTPVSPPFYPPRHINSQSGGQSHDGRTQGTPPMAATDHSSPATYRRIRPIRHNKFEDNMKRPGHSEGEVVNQNPDEESYSQTAVVTSHSLMMDPRVSEEGSCSIFTGHVGHYPGGTSSDSSLADGYPRLHRKGSWKVRGEQEIKLSIANGANGQSDHPLRNKSSKENPRRPDAIVDQIQKGVDLPDPNDVASPTRHQQLGIITDEYSPHSTRARIAGVARKGATGPEFVEWNICDSSVADGYALAHESSLADGYTHMRKPEERNRGERTNVCQSKDRNLENYNSKGICCFPWARK